jgi:hypothetical protein
VLVTVTPYLRLHRDEVIYARLRGNSIVIRFVSMKAVRVPVDDLTEEARRWLLPSMAPRQIPVEDLEEQDEAQELDLDERSIRPEAR